MSAFYAEFKKDVPELDAKSTSVFLSKLKGDVSELEKSFAKKSAHKPRLNEVFIKDARAKANGQLVWENNGNFTNIINSSPKKLKVSPSNEGILNVGISSGMVERHVPTFALVHQTCCTCLPLCGQAGLSTSQHLSA